MDSAATTTGTRQKALALNLDAASYGTFAEIGGGQEVARWFFSVGGAAGTVAKTISAYDMAVSDGLYGATRRYVSRQRLEAMLEQEFAQLASQLSGKLGDSKCFFAFADTVATSGFRQPGPGRGWIGIRFQARPREDPSQIIIHAHLADSTAAREQEALGILGVNLVYGAFFRRDDPAALIASLIDELSRDSPPQSASHSLEGYVSRLRRILAASGSSVDRRGADSLDLGNASLDARVFVELADGASRAAKDADHEQASQLAGDALAVWRGPALADVSLGSSGRTERERLEELRLRTLEQRFEAELAPGP